MKRILALLLMLMLVLPHMITLAAAAENFDMHLPIAYMDTKFTCGCSRGGSGTMIGRYGLITAAHNLYCHVHGKPLKTCDFYFGAKSNGSYHYRYNGKFTYTVYDSFTHGYNAQNDIGFVIFETAVGEKTGWYASMAGSDHDLHEEYFNLLTYDFNRNLKGLFEIQYVLDPLQLYWQGQLDATAGGPVAFTSDDYEFPTVVAVYTSMDNNGYSYGRRLTFDVIQDMRSAGAFN